MIIASEVEPIDESEGSFPDAFVGRYRELRSLAKLLHGSGRRMRSAFVQGEAGIGKTRLLQEFLRHARQKGVRALQGCCYQTPETGPYFPFLQVLDQLRLGGLPSQRLLQSLAGEALDQSNWLELSEDVRGRRVRFLRALSDAILQETASTETLLFIEDIQWADLGSLLVLNNLLDVRADGLLIVCTARMDEPTGVDVRQLLARIEDKSIRVTLRGLTDVEVREIVSNLTRPDRITEHELRDLQSLTNGNPLFIRELLLHLQGAGLLGSHSLQEATARSQTPRRLTHVIDLRLRSLPPHLYRTLATCSVIGLEFSAALVAQAQAMPETAIGSNLESCVARGILQPLEGLVASRYRFAHPLFAMRLYEMLRPTERRRLHRRIAHVATRGGAPLTVGELARHYALGFGPAGGRETIEHCEAAARQADRLMAYETAAQFWELALKCTRPRTRRKRAELHCRLGWSLWAASNWTQAANAWDEAVHLFESLKDWRAVAELALALGDMHRWRHQVAESERWLKRALELLPDDSKERGRALALLGSIRCLQNESGPGLQLLQDAVKTMGRDTLDPLVAYWLSYGFLTSGDPARAYAVAKDGLDEARRRGSSNATCLLAASLFHHELSALNADAARSCARTIEDAADPGDTMALVYLLTCKALLWGYAGMWTKVVQACERWMSQVRLAGRYQVANARMYWGEAKLALGDTSAAQGEMLRALPDLEYMRPLASLHLARVLLQLGESEEAASIVSRYSQDVISSGRFINWRAVLGDVASCLDMPELWTQCRDVLKQETRPVVMVYSPISVQRVLGRLNTRLGLWAVASDDFDTALHQLAEGGARWELTQTYADYADMRRTRRRRGDIRKAAALELQAETIVNELGIQHTALQRASTPSIDGNRFGLTGRELEVLVLVAEGRRNQEIAETLTLSPRTVERHLENIFGKMGVDGRTEAVVEAMQEGLLGPLASPPLPGKRLPAVGGPAGP
jgi:DNA-binding CsgD family transcriptional regulator